MSNPSTVTLVLGNLGGQVGAVDGAINTSVGARDGNTGAWISGTITAAGSIATMFPMVRTVEAAGGFAITISNLGKTGFDGSKLTVGDILTIGAGVAVLFGAPAIIGFGLTVAGIGWTFYTLKDPSRNLSIPDLYARAKNWTWPRDPIILDLDGNGLETVGLAANIHFDHDGDGVLTKTGWAGKSDALLVWDRNVNGFLADIDWSGLADFDTLPHTAGITVLLDEFKVHRLIAGDDSTYLINNADILLAGVLKSHCWLDDGCVNDQLWRAAA